MQIQRKNPSLMNEQCHLDKEKVHLEQICRNAYLISMEGKSLKDELLKHFEYSSEHPTNSSFNQRSEQIKPEAFEHLFQRFLFQEEEILMHLKKYFRNKGGIR